MKLWPGGQGGARLDTKLPLQYGAQTNKLLNNFLLRLQQLPVFVLELISRGRIAWHVLLKLSRHCERIGMDAEGSIVCDS